MTLIAAFAAVIVLGLLSLALTLPSDFWRANPSNRYQLDSRTAAARAFGKLYAADLLHRARHQRAGARLFFSRMSRGDVLRRSETALSDLFFQDGAGSWIHVMDLVAYRTGHRLIDVAVL